MKFQDKIKESIKKIKNSKQTYNLLIVLIIGIMILIFASIFNNDIKEEGKLHLDEIDKESSNSITEDYSQLLERKLESILSQIKGVGKVEVMITLEETREKIPATNNTKTYEKTSEKDSQGGLREINREDSNVEIARTDGDSFIVLKEIQPEVKGVIVVAEGAYDIEIKEKLYQAVKTVLGVSGNRVEVYSSN